MYPIQVQLVYTVRLIISNSIRAADAVYTYLQRKKEFIFAPIPLPPPLSIHDYSKGFCVFNGHILIEIKKKSTEKRKG